MSMIAKEKGAVTACDLFFEYGLLMLQVLPWVW